jgi:ribosomal protein S18 acetylase RimI-like enzyme
MKDSTMPDPLCPMLTPSDTAKAPTLPLRLVEADSDDCFALMQQFASADELLQWGGDGFTYPLQRLAFLQQLHKPDTHAYTLWLGKQRVGFGQICDRFGCHHLARLIIFTPFRGRHLARHLLEALILAAFRLQGNRVPSLFVLRDNQHAIGIYQHLGFTMQNQPGFQHEQLYFMQLTGPALRDLVQRAMRQWRFTQQQWLRQPE